jgi:hypothetical protein
MGGVSRDLWGRQALVYGSGQKRHLKKGQLIQDLARGQINFFGYMAVRPYRATANGASFGVPAVRRHFNIFNKLTCSVSGFWP